MNYRIITFTTGGSEREDGSVYYAATFLVSHATLNFSEPLFAIEDAPYVDAIPDAEAIFLVAVKALGYTVHDVPVQIITIE